MATIEYHAGPQRPLNTVIAMRTTGTPSVCGCAADCGCTPTVAKLSPQYHVPDEASALIKIEELNEFVRDINCILEQNYIPPMPCMFTHFCIPFSPICAMSYYASRRTKRLQAYIEKSNTEKYTARQCHWEMSDMAGMFLEVYLVSHHTVASNPAPMGMLLVPGNNSSAAVIPVGAYSQPVQTASSVASQPYSPVQNVPPAYLLGMKR